MSKKIRIALIDPLVNPVPQFVPTGLCYLSSYIKRALAEKVEVRIFQITFSALKRVIAYKPEVVGFSSLTHNFDLTQRMAQKLRQSNPQAIYIIGGQHISMAPWSMPRIFDYALLGEGEEAFLKYIESVLYNNTGSNVNNDELYNLQYWQDDELIKRDQLPLIKPLDLIPHPDRESIENIESIITLDRFQKFSRSGTRSMQITTSRGCPHKCKFCQPSQMWKNYRMHSPEYIADEIDEVQKSYAINTIHIEDDLFISSKKRLSELIDLLGKRNLLHKIKYYVAGRTKIIDREMVDLLKQLGVVKVEFGLESGSDKISQYLKGSLESSEINKTAITELNNAGISVYASFIVGSPPERTEDLKLTRKMIHWVKQNYKYNTCGVNIATPLPGTELWDDAVERKIIDPGTIDWRKLSTLSSLPKSKSEFFYINRHMPAKTILRYVKYLNLMMYIGTPKEFFLSLPRRFAKIPGKIKHLIFH